MFYTYLWLREDGTPYYVGKGTRGRAYRSHKGHRPPKDYSRIHIQYWSDEATAFSYEIYQIDFWGRKDLGTGILRNRTDGGEGGAGMLRPDLVIRNFGNQYRLGIPHTEESRRKIAKVSDAQVLEIRALRSQGWLQRELAEKFNIDRSHVGLLCRGKGRRFV
jgi:hypothetical protein